MWEAMEVYGWIRELALWTGFIVLALLALLILFLLVAWAHSAAWLFWRGWRLRRWQRALRSTSTSFPEESRPEEEKLNDAMLKERYRKAIPEFYERRTKEYRPKAPR